MYKKAAEFWAELRVELLTATAFLNDKTNWRQLWQLYWAGHQVLDLDWCLKTISILKSIKYLLNILLILLFVTFHCNALAFL